MVEGAHHWWGDAGHLEQTGRRISRELLLDCLEDEVELVEVVNLFALDLQGIEVGFERLPAAGDRR